MEKNRVARSPEEIETNIIGLESRIKALEEEYMAHLANEHNVRFTKPVEEVKK